MAMRDASVILYRSTDTGAPSCSGLAGMLIPVLDACLVNGYNETIPDSLEVAGGLATLTRAAGHGFTCPGAPWGGIDAGQVVEVAGVAGALAGLNRRWKASVISPSVLRWECGLPDGTATGTITVKKPPLGFTKVFSGTNKAVYRSSDIQGNQADLRVDDTTAQAARVKAYERMTSIDAGTGQFPLDSQISGGYYWGKSEGSTSALRGWAIIGDARGFYIRHQNTAAGNFAQNAFIEINSDRPGDQYCTMLTGGISTTTNQQGVLYYLGPGFHTHTVPRSYHQLNGCIEVGKYTLACQVSGTGYQAELTMPSLAGNKYLVAPIEIWESANVRRGILPGCYCPLHHGLAVEDAAVFHMQDQLDARILLHWRHNHAGSNYAQAFDLTGPWR